MRHWRTLSARRACIPPQFFDMQDPSRFPHRKVLQHIALSDTFPCSLIFLSTLVYSPRVYGGRLGSILTPPSLDESSLFSYVRSLSGFLLLLVLLSVRALPSVYDFLF